MTMPTVTETTTYVPADRDDFIAGDSQDESRELPVALRPPHTQPARR